jgi:hypothetical protein
MLQSSRRLRAFQLRLQSLHLLSPLVRKDKEDALSMEMSALHRSCRDEPQQHSILPCLILPAALLCYCSIDANSGLLTNFEVLENIKQSPSQPNRTHLLTSWHPQQPARLIDSACAVPACSRP